MINTKQVIDKLQKSDCVYSSVFSFNAELVPISSTVIPLSVYEVSYGLGGKPSEEYKMAYLKKLRKKVKHDDEDEDPDTLITSKCFMIML